MEEDDFKILEYVMPEPKKHPNPTTPSIRQAIIKASGEGLSHRQVAKIFNISMATVSKIVTRWYTEGTVEKPQRKPQKRRRMCSEAIEQFIVESVKNDPFKTPADVISEVFKKFNETVSYGTATTILKRHNSFKTISQKDLSQSKSS